MRPRLSGSSIVIPGHWNRMIFTPEWVAKAIYDCDRVEMLVPLDPLAPALYRDELAELRVTNLRLDLVARQSTEVAVRRIEGLACRVLDVLSVTPVRAVGINFAYVEDDPGEKVLDLFRLPDDSEIHSEGWNITKRVLKRELRRDEVTLNLKYTLTVDGDVEVDFNFHQDVELATDAIQIIKDKVLERHEQGLDLVAKTLELHVEEGDTDDE